MRICEATYGRSGSAREMASATLRSTVRCQRLTPANGGAGWNPARPARHLARIARSRKPLHVADLRKDRAYLDGHALTVTAVDVAGVRTLVGVPMLKNNELIGVI